MLNRLPSVVFVMLLLVLSACRDPPDYPNEPVIEYLSMNKNTMVQSNANSDQVAITITFTDGDGDLGSTENELETKVYVHDTRTEDPREQILSIPLVPELGTGNGISGEMTFRVFTDCCIYPNSSVINCQPMQGFPTDTIIYEIFIKDRAGNESNHVFSEPMILLCQ